MNSRLRAKLLRQRPTSAARPEPDEGLRLLGEGVDALLLRMDGRGALPDRPEARAQVRLLRYLRGRGIFIVRDKDLALLELRRKIGAVFQMAWRDGRRPNLAIGRPLELSSRRPATAAPQRQASR